MRPVNNEGCAVFGNDNVCGRKITVANNACYAKLGKTELEIITNGRVQIRIGDLACHFVLKSCQKGRLFGVDLSLQINKEIEVFVKALGSAHKLCQRFAVDAIHHECPFAVNHGNFLDLRNIETCLFDSRLVQSFVENFRFGPFLFVVNFDQAVTVLIYDFSFSDCNDVIKIH